VVNAPKRDETRKKNRLDIEIQQLQFCITLTECLQPNENALNSSLQLCTHGEKVMKLLSKNVNA